MYCSNCGNKIKDGEMFCSNCGNKIEGANQTNETANFIESKKAKQYSNSDTLKMDDNVDDAGNGEKRKSTMETVMQQQKTSIFQRVKAFYKKHNWIVWLAIGFLLLSGTASKLYYHVNPTAAVKEYYLTDQSTGNPTKTVGEFADIVGGTFTEVELDDGTYNVILDYKTRLFTSSFTFNVDPSSDNTVKLTYEEETDNYSGDVYTSETTQQCMTGLYYSMCSYGAGN